MSQQPFFFRFSILVFCWLNFFSLATEAYAQSISTEDKIKASFVFNFIRFVKWPTNKLKETSKPINVCIIKNSSRKNHFVKAFQPVIGKLVNGHPLKLHQISNPEKIKHCHLIYIDQAEKNNLTALLPLIAKNHILSVSDMNSFCAAGGIIGLVKRKGKIKVEINLQVARSYGFTISSNLLEVATIVGNH